MMQGKVIHDDFNSSYFDEMMADIYVHYESKLKESIIKQIQEWIEDVMTEDVYGSSHHGSFVTVQGMDEHKYIVTLTSTKDKTCFYMFYKKDKDESRFISIGRKKDS